MKCLIMAAAISGTVLLTGCPAERGTRDTVPGDATERPVGQTATGALATMDLARVAGSWQVEATPETGADRSPTRYTLNATPERTGWTITFENGQTVPLRIIAVEGDSVVTEAGPFASVRRANTQVRTHNVLRLDGDRLTGWTRARYETAGPDTVLMLRTEGRRTQ